MQMVEQNAGVWKSASLVSAFLEGVRGAIPLAQEQIDVMLRLIEACGRPVRRFLDLGCGDGALSAAMLERFPDAQGVLVDFSLPMLDAARNRFGGQDARVRLVNADYGLPRWTDSVQDDGSFDAVVSGFSIHHQEDARKREVYSEVFHLLEREGIFINVEHVASATAWVEAVHDEMFIDHLHRHHSGKTREEVVRDYYHRPDKAANILAPVEAQCEWLRQIGFADVDCYLKVFELAVFGGRKLQ